MVNHPGLGKQNIKDSTNINSHIVSSTATRNFCGMSVRENVKNRPFRIDIVFLGGYVFKNDKINHTLAILHISRNHII